MASAAVNRSMDMSRDETGDLVLLPPLLSISKSVRQLVGIKLADIDVAVGQDQFLLLFENHAPRSVIDIANALSVRASTVSKMADILERKGWVVRLPDVTDARRVLLHLTDSGRKKAEAVRGIEQALEAELAAAFGQDKQIAATLGRLDLVLATRLRRLR
ncbi:MarR family transcriptional regulator [Aureimonas leprariae]|uniref:MarR family transcriptional regulator n=1 Tax=Plantimonas leprariae TaxID=2615207 RepID=A0A7V7PQ86_9HYPH|nr:MarR family transcriptional regulator [Aureimonas leprariae]KAB0680304.1 MarR family transcriptional regulator [Aureimonas leprariae]